MHDNTCQRIIVAEDDPAARALLARHLQRDGYEVVGCDDGQAALDTILAQQGGIVIADWNMPRMDGVTLCREVRRRCDAGELSFVYLILLTANSETDKIIAGLEAGADDYLTKPYHARELLARLRTGTRIFALQKQLRDRQQTLAALNEKLTELANTDALTGLFNRRYLFERLEQLWSLATRHPRPFSCLMFDIDRFKSINDTHGHAAGDAVLRGVARVCGELVRREDILARFGGEEFCVLCPETAGEGAAALAERIRGGIAGRRFEHEGVVIPVTTSVGVASRAESHAGPDALIADADAMLYRAKHNGRNQTWRKTAAGEELCVTNATPAASPETAPGAKVGV